MSRNTETLEAPFPWFGGKSRVASEVWSAFGNVQNYVEPFFGSGAVLLGRPHDPKIETINDKDALVSNFWRAIKADPESVAAHADWPVSENDLHARHAWLIGERPELTERIEGDPDFFDAKIAGWWVWGICSWIGGEWCSGNGPWKQVDGKLVKVSGGNGVNRKLVHLGRGLGVNRKRVHLGDTGQGTSIYEWFAALSSRLRNVRICSGDWSRVCGPTPTVKNGLTGVFLDPPYSAEAGRDVVYAAEDLSVAHNVRRWCLDNGDNPLLRIALCGYAGEHDDLGDAGWRVHAWKARGGYGSQGNGRGRENSGRERIWFSPHCLAESTPMLF